MILVYLFTCLLVYLLLLLSYIIRARTDNARIIRACEGQLADEAKEQSTRVPTPSQHIRLARPSSAPTHGENLAAGLPWLLMKRAFSTRQPAMTVNPIVRLICDWLPPAFVPTMFRP